GGAADLLLHLDLERVPAPAGLPGLQPEPDRSGRARPGPGRAHRRRDHAGRLRAARHPARDRLLPHLPAHPDPRRHRRCGQMTAEARSRPPLISTMMMQATIGIRPQASMPARAPKWLVSPPMIGAPMG